jgi:L-lactate dehydrogenase
VIKLKGYTSWAIGLCVSELTGSILRNKKTIFALSTMAKGCQGIEEEVYVSLPCVLAENGVSAIVQMRLTESEKAKLQKSAHEMHELFKAAKL